MSYDKAALVEDLISILEKHGVIAFAMVTVRQSCVKLEPDNPVPGEMTISLGTISGSCFYDSDDQRLKEDLTRAYRDFLNRKGSAVTFGAEELN